MNKSKLAKCLSITDYSFNIVSIVRALHNILEVNFLINGFTYISIGFSVSINDWIKIFKNK